jgi:hypothetical protein
MEGMGTFTYNMSIFLKVSEHPQKVDQQQKIESRKDY